MKKLFIIHFAPIENYPPSTNLIKYFDEIDNVSVKVFTTETFLPFTFYSVNISIKRIINPTKFNRFLRLLAYIYFQFTVFIDLMKSKPSKILYYETLSSFAPIIYCWLKGWKIDLFIHYHEYTTPEEYKNGMLISRFFHWFEKKTHNKAKWISLTNDQRVKLFLNDNPEIKNTIVRTLPNFPPKAWLKDTSFKKEFNSPIKIVFVGSLSNETMFYKEFAEWVLSQNGNVIWDIYSQQISQDVLTHIENTGNGIIKFRGYVNYDELNEVLYNYDIGVILYRCLVPNFRYNATNKLFEYLACGLDVWLPEELVGAHDYLTKDTYPKVIKLNFNKLYEYNIEKLISRDGLSYKPSNYFAEDVYEPFINLLLSDD